MIDNENVMDVNPSTAELSSDPHVAPLSEVAQPLNPKKEQEERNFATLRQLKERAERERDEALRLLQEKKPSSSSKLSIGTDELAEGKHLQTLQEEIERLRSEMSDYKQYSSTATAEARLKATYSDIDKVVSKENLEILSVQEPELYASIMANGDFYGKGAAAYKAIKKFGIHTDDVYETDRARVQENSNKPRPTNSISPQKGDSPLSHANAFANGLTPELRAQLYKEMMAYRKDF